MKRSSFIGASSKRIKRLPKIYYAYEKMLEIWERCPDGTPGKADHIQAFQESLDDILLEHTEYLD